MEFGGGFGTAVGITRVQRHPFFIAIRPIAGKDFVGADVDHFRTEFLAGQGDILCAQPVDFVSQFRVLGAAIDVGVGGGVDDEIGLGWETAVNNCFSVCYIYFR